MARVDDPATKDLNEGRAEALHALLHSLAPGSSGDTSGGKLSAEQVRKLSDKLGEILGDKAEVGDGAKRNEKGELVNEEGLPIIDINEPVPAADYAFKPDPNSTFDDPDLLPLWTLSPEEKARRKAERERILDLLEQEESVQHARHTEETRKRLEEEMEKRKAAAQEEMDKLKKAKELQKKMGKALMRNVLQSREEQEKEKADQEELDRRAALAKPIKPRKSVTFAEEGPEIVDGVGKREKGKTMDWGDVAPGTLRKASDATNGFAERQTMKLNVVERPLTSLRSPGPPPRDSDDESEPETATTQDSEDEENLRDMFSRYRMQSPPPPSIDSEDESLADEEPSEWNDEDFDTARHQREVALAYYEKRKTIGAEVSNAMRAHTHEHDGNGWDQPEVPLEATLASTPPKPTASRFKADRLANAPSTTGLASHSLGASVLSANTAPMKRAIRMGRLENGKLIGGDDGDSDEDITAEDENAKQFLEMLRNGEVTNVGPLDISVKPTSQEQTPSAQPVDPSQKHRDTTEPSVSSKVSKFKLALSQPDLTTGQTSPSLASGGHTPILSATRSSPKMSSGYSSGTSSPTQLPQYNPAGPSRVGGIASRQMPGMVVESPSFVRPSGMPFQPLQSVILESPSFQPPSSNTSTASSTPTLVSTPTPTSLNGVNGSASPGGSAAPTPTPIRAGVIERRPPTVTARTPETARPMAGNAEQPQKVSRFKAQRS